MKNALLLSLLFCTLGAVQAQGVITVLHAGTSTFYYFPATTLDQVLTEYVGANDTVILPGGVMPYSNMTLAIPMTIIGAGFHQNGVPVTNKTVIPLVNFGLTIASSANGSSFHGIDFESPIYFQVDVQNMNFSRCEFGSGVGMDPNFTPDPSSIFFKQCLFRQSVTVGLSSTAINFSNSVFQSSLAFQNGASNDFVQHCLFMNANLSSTQASSVTYSDNIFVFNSAGPSLNNIGHFVDNLMVTPTSTPPVVGPGTNFIGSAQASPLASQFPASTPLTAYDYNYTYMPVAGTMAYTMISSDGTDAGIYGGLPGSPWKPLAIPFNPHWDVLVTPNSTVNGVLPGVQIQGSAQPN